MKRPFDDMETEENEEEVIDTRLPLQDVLQIVQTIVTTDVSIRQKKRSFNQLYPKFAEHYPILFEMACSPNFDMVQFNKMMFMANKIQQKELTQNEASAVIGQSLFNTFVKPNLDMAKESTSDNKN